MNDGVGVPIVIHCCGGETSDGVLLCWGGGREAGRLSSCENNTEFSM